MISMEEEFCKICVLFHCGIHKPIINHESMVKFNERLKCICKNKNKVIKDKRYDNGSFNKILFDKLIKKKIYIDQEVSNNKNMFIKYDIGCLDKKIVNNIYYNKIKKWINESKLRPCVKSLILKLKYKIHISCKNIPYQRLNKKKVFNSTEIIRKNNFYEPCANHKYCRKKSCKCIKNEISCELSCGCINCYNIRYCVCKVCDDNCFCALNSKECSEICNCSKYCMKNYREIYKKFFYLKAINKNQLFDADYRKYCYNRNTSKKIPTKTQLFNIISHIPLSKTALQNYCYNRNISNKFEADLVVYKSFRHGYGLFSNELINIGEFVIVYNGEIISDREAERRGNFYEINCCSYLFNLVNKDDDCLYSLDAFFSGNKSRYINHSKTHANIKSKIYLYKGLPFVIFEAIKTIYPGDELLFDYRFTETHKKIHRIID